MGNRRQKPSEQLQGRGSRYKGSSSLVLVSPDARRDVPPCPRGLTKAAREWYAAFCADPISQLVTPAAWPMVQRLATLIARREVVEKKIWACPTVEGSMGQDVPNPLLSLQKEYSREIEKIAGELGVLPLSRMRLGIAVGQAQEMTRTLRDTLDGPAAAPERRVYRAGGE